MEGIAHEAGFRSRNTFIMAVKKRSGKTPSEFFNAKSIA
jgi:AraC-like DNA-binding protein